MLKHVDVIGPDVEAAVAFYRKLGVSIPDEAIWRHGGRAHHVGITLPSGVELSLSSTELTSAYAAAWSGSGSILITGVASRSAVDEVCGDLHSAGHAVFLAPIDAFWGSRYAIVRDPAGNHVGIMSPQDAEHGPVPGFDE